MIPQVAVLSDEAETKRVKQSSGLGDQKENEETILGWFCKQDKKHDNLFPWAYFYAIWLCVCVDIFHIEYMY